MTEMTLEMAGYVRSVARELQLPQLAQSGQVGMSSFRRARRSHRVWFALDGRPFFVVSAAVDPLPLARAARVARGRPRALRSRPLWLHEPCATPSTVSTESLLPAFRRPAALVGMLRPKSRPNILMIIADDHQADAISALGHPVVRTPVLDDLAREGTVFTRTRIMGSLMGAVCAPTRACLLTGRHLFRADAEPELCPGPEYRVHIPEDACTLPERFRAAGYQTHITGKWHNCMRSLTRSFTSGSSVFLGGMCEHTAVPVFDLDPNGVYRPEDARVANGFSSEVFANAAIDFLQKADGTDPFFLYLAFISPHDPRTPPKAFRQLYDADELPLPDNFLPVHPFDNGELHIRDEELAGFPRDPQEIRRHLAEYYGMISHQDAQIGRVVGALRQSGLLDSTIVVYLSDHGLALGQHGLMGKQNLYEHSVRVPLVVRGPGVPRGLERSVLAYSFDIYTTLCDLAGIEPPADLDSRSLVPAFAPTPPVIRNDVFAAYMACQRMVTDGRWKLIRYRVNGHERIQLFNLERDPHEMHDLAGLKSHAPTIARLRTRLADWQDCVGDRWMRTESPATMAD